MVARLEKARWKIEGEQGWSVEADVVIACGGSCSLRHWTKMKA